MIEDAFRLMHHYLFSFHILDIIHLICVLIENTVHPQIMPIMHVIKLNLNWHWIDIRIIGKKNLALCPIFDFTDVYWKQNTFHEFAPSSLAFQQYCLLKSNLAIYNDISIQQNVLYLW